MFKFGFFENEMEKEEENGKKAGNGQAIAGIDGSYSGDVTESENRNKEVVVDWKFVNDICGKLLMKAEMRKDEQKTEKTKKKADTEKVSSDLSDKGDDIANMKISRVQIGEEIILIPLPHERIVENDKDVVSGVYEGGFKLWECSLDLSRLIISHSHAIPKKSAGEPVYVLDLGCGNGLLGTTAMMKSEDIRVSFHDLNKDVIDQSTINTVALNSLKYGKAIENGDKRARFFFGPWNKSTIDMLTDNGKQRYDVILTSETLYNNSYFPILYDILSSCLAFNPESGILIASKRYYFGVGGGVHSFLEYVEKKKQFKSTLCQSFEDGFSNVRDIVLLKWI